MPRRRRVPDLRAGWSVARDLARALVREWRDDRVNGLAAEIAFFGLLSLFPTMLAVAAALGLLGSVVGGNLAQRAESEVIDFLQRVLTSEASGTIDSVQRLFDRPSPGLLTLGIATALWAASRGFVAVINALDIAYDLDERRGYVRLRGLALALALGSVVVVALVLSMVVVGPLLGTGHDVADALGLGGAFATFWDWARWPVVLAVMVAWATTVLHVAPNHHTPWRWDLPGALLATASWAVVSLGLQLYLQVASGANQVLGTLGGALIVLLWLYLLAIGLVLGGELNAILADRSGWCTGATPAVTHRTDAAAGPHRHGAGAGSLRRGGWSRWRRSRRGRRA